MKFLAKATLFLGLFCTAPAMAANYSSAAAENGAIVGTGRFTQISIYATNHTSTAGFMAILDATALPASGAMVPKDCIALPANSTASLRYDINTPTLFTNGIVVTLTSASTCFTSTTGTITGFIKGIAQ